MTVISLPAKEKQSAEQTILLNSHLITLINLDNDKPKLSLTQSSYFVQLVLMGDT